jgi:succinyl-diaminopimelate desuccinylase
MNKQLNEIVDKHSDELIAALQDMIRIKSVREEAKEGMPFGEGPCKALNKQLEIAEKLGFKVTNVDNYYGYAEYGEGEDYVCALGHLDVVPEGDGWDHAPYAAEIADGKIWGRGTVDDKGPINAALFGVYALKEAGFKPSKKIRVIFGCDEEVGCEDMDHYNELEKPPVYGFTPDADFPAIFAEKGILHFVLSTPFDTAADIKDIKGGIVVNAVPDSAEAVIAVKPAAAADNITVTDLGNGQYKVSASGLTAHGSMPELGVNAVGLLIKYLVDNSLIAGEEGEKLALLRKYVCDSTRGTEMGIEMEDETGELSMNMGIIEVKDGKLRAHMDLRYPCTRSDEDILKAFRNDFPGFEIEDISQDKPLYAKKDSKLIKTITGVYSEFYNDDSEAIAIGGGTYAKHLANIVAFGPCLPNEDYVEHTNHEFIGIDHLITLAKVYANAMEQLTK